MNCKKHGETKGYLLEKFNVVVCVKCAESNAYYHEMILAEYKLQNKKVVAFSAPYTRDDLQDLSH